MTRRLRTGLLATLAFASSTRAAQESWAELLRPHSPPDAVEQYLSPFPLAQEIGRRELFAAQEEGVRALLLRLREANETERCALLDLLAVFAEVEFDRRSLVHAHHQDPSPAVRESCAGLCAAASIAANEPDVRRLLGDPVAAVGDRLIAGWTRLPFLERCALADRFAAELAAVLSGRDPKPRENALSLLALSDGSIACDALLSPAITADPQLGELLLDRLVARPPRWPADRLRAVLLPLDDLATERWIRARLLLDEIGDPVSFDEEHRRALLRTATDPVAHEHDAAQSALARFGAREPRPFVALVPQLEEELPFDSALESSVRLRGPAALEDFAEWFPRLSTERRIAVLSLLARTPSEATTRWLDARWSLQDGDLSSAFVECLLRQPESRLRAELLRRALALPRSGAVLRAIEGLCKLAQDQDLEPLLRSAERLPDAGTRGRAVQFVADAFGASHPREVLSFLLARTESGSAEDRARALSAVPFVALGDDAQALGELLFERFHETAPDRLVVVLAQIGGPVAERSFQSLAREPGAHAARLRPFLLRQAALLSGAPSRTVLLEALDSPSDREREIALRSLLARSDPAVFERGPDVLASLPANARNALLRDLDRMGAEPGFLDLLGRLVDRFPDDDARMALLEIGAARGAPWVGAQARAWIDDPTDPALFDAALYALRAEPDERTRALWASCTEPLRDGPEHTVLLGDEAIARARAVALALGDRQLEGAGETAARVLQVGLDRDSFRRCCDSFFTASEPRRFAADPELVQVLARAPDGPEAWDRAIRASGSLPLLWNEASLIAQSDAMARAGASAAWCARIEAGTRTQWPPVGLYDLAGEVHELRRLHPTALGGFLDGLEPAALRRFPALERSYWNQELEIPQEESAFHRSDPFFDWDPDRTVRTLAVLAAQEGPSFTPNTLRRAAREAGHHAILVAGLAELALEIDLDLARELADRAVSFAPFLPHALGLAAFVRHLAGEPTAERDALCRRERESVESGLAPAHPLNLARLALYAADRGDPDGAERLLLRAMVLAPELEERIAVDPALAGLRPLLNRRGGHHSGDDDR